MEVIGPPKRESRMFTLSRAQIKGRAIIQRYVTFCRRYLPGCENAYLVLNRVVCEVPEAVMERISRMDIPLAAVILADAGLTSAEDAAGQDRVNLVCRAALAVGVASMR